MDGPNAAFQRRFFMDESWLTTESLEHMLARGIMFNDRKNLAFYVVVAKRIGTSAVAQLRELERNCDAGVRRMAGEILANVG
jgi:hypothetical protein